MFYSTGVVFTTLFLWRDLINTLCMNSTTVIGIAASAFTGISLLPQLIKLVKEKKPADISMLMLATLFTGLALWIWYGCRINDPVIVVANTVSLSLNAAIVLVNGYYVRKGIPGA
jgi:MtN3 and saliva related transmembrane protein